MFGKTRLASRSKRRAAGGYQRIIAAQVVPRLRDRTSKDRHCETANADHKGKYLAWWTKDFRVLINIPFYYCFFGINQSQNFTHYPIAKALIEAGIDVIGEKSLTATLEDAVALEKQVRESGRFVGVTYTYSGYPMVHEARVRIANGEIGKVRTVQVEYPLEWMATGIVSKGNVQAAWRTDANVN